MEREGESVNAVYVRPVQASKTHVGVDGEAKAEVPGHVARIADGFLATDKGTYALSTYNEALRHLLSGVARSQLRLRRHNSCGATHLARSRDLDASVTVKTTACIDKGTASGLLVVVAWVRDEEACGRGHEQRE